MLEIKGLYKVKKNWSGDPCAPNELIWDGLNCSYTNSSHPRIISLNLSSSGLTGEISTSVGNLTQLRYLDLSNNELTGGIPSFLAGLLNLTFIDLMGNNLTGLVPRELYDRITAGTLTLRIENPQFPDEKKGKNWKIIIAAAVGSIVLVLILVGAAIIFFCKRNGVRNNNSVQVQQPKDGKQNKIRKPDDVFVDSGSRQFSYDDLVKITRNFSTIIGEGGFGLVYLGVLDGGQQVAVKMLSKASSQGQKEFQNEALLLSKIHHRNLVPLFGYCSNPGNLSLVYEYMEEGSIDDHLSGKVGRTKPFAWKKRLETAIGAAQGLEYLHEGCKPAIVHRDVKTQNILLDGDMEAKIGDFGLSKIFRHDIQSYVSTVVMGTPGYLDPEYTRTQKLNEKSDVYSFGIVLLQLVTGLPAIIRGNENTHIVDFILPWYEKGAIEDIVDERFDGNYNINSVWKTMDVALACAARLSAERPTMGEVVAELKVGLSLEGTTQGVHQSSYQPSYNPSSIISGNMTPSNEELPFKPQAK